LGAFPCTRSGCDQNWPVADPSIDTVRLGRMDVQQLVKDAGDAKRFFSPPRGKPRTKLASSPSVSTPEFCPAPPTPRSDGMRTADVNDATSDDTSDHASGSSQGAGHDVPRRSHDAAPFGEFLDGGPPRSAASPPRAVARREGRKSANRLRTNAICMPGDDCRAPVIAPAPPALRPQAPASQTCPKVVTGSDRQQEARFHRPEATLTADQMQQVHEAKEWVGTFLQRHGYAGVNAKRTRMFKSKYPLHTAVKLGGNSDVVRLLLWAMADPMQQNSAGLTPLQLAERINVQNAAGGGGSHDSIIKALAKVSDPLAVAAAAHARRREIGACGGA